jgi:hypothetical protein
MPTSTRAAEVRAPWAGASAPPISTGDDTHREQSLAATAVGDLQAFRHVDVLDLSYSAGSHPARYAVHA